MIVQAQHLSDALQSPLSPLSLLTSFFLSFLGSGKIFLVFWLISFSIGVAKSTCLVKAKDVSHFYTTIYCRTRGRNSIKSIHWEFTI